MEDGSFVRVERSDDGEKWEARTKAGVTLRFGGAAHTEVEGDRVSAYLLREELDRHGHEISYEWDSTEGRALVTRVVWNDFDSTSRTFCASSAGVKGFGRKGVFGSSSPLRTISAEFSCHRDHLQRILPIVV